MTIKFRSCARHGIGQKTMRLRTLVLLAIFLPISCFSQHVITTKSGQKMNCKITQIGDSTLSYVIPSKSKSKTTNDRVRVMKKDNIASYRLQDGIEYKVCAPKVIVQKDTIVSIVKTEENLELLEKYAQQQNEAIGNALKKAGTVSLAIGVPCAAAGIACLLYANLLPNPMTGCTTSKLKAEADGDKYVTVDEYTAKTKEFNRKTRNAEVAGYILTPLGGGLTIAGIPLFVAGDKMLQMKVQFTGNGAGVAINF